MKLPELVALRINRGMFHPNLLLFEEALNYVLLHHFITQQRWESFKQDILIIENKNSITVQSEKRDREGIETSGKKLSEYTSVQSHPNLKAKKTVGSSNVEDRVIAPVFSDVTSPQASSHEHVKGFRKSSLIVRKDGKKYTDGIR